MSQPDRTEPSLSRRDFLVRTGVLATSGALLTPASAFGHGSGGEQIFVAAELIEPLSREAAIVELLNVGDRVYVQAAPNASSWGGGETTSADFLSFSPGEMLLIGATQPPLTAAECPTCVDRLLYPVYEAVYWLEAEYVTTIHLGGTLDVDHEREEVDGLLQRLFSPLISPSP